MSFNVEEFINRFKDRANAVKDRPMPPIGGDERMQFMKQAELDYQDYMIISDERPDQVAEAVYGDPRYDWVVLITNNITNIRDQWPLNAQDFQKYLLAKYGSEEELTKVHHYITEVSIDTKKRIVVPEGLRVDSNFNSQYLDQSTRVEIDYGGTLNDIATVDLSLIHI